VNLATQKKSGLAVNQKIERVRVFADFDSGHAHKYSSEESTFLTLKIKYLGFGIAVAFTLLESNQSKRFPFW
jgi:hypothetical protein